MNKPKGNEEKGSQATEGVVILPDSVVTVTRMNHIIEVQHLEKFNSRNNIKKLDKNRYLEISTGEIKEFEHSENRAQNYNSLRQTFKKLRYLINNNFTGAGNELHVTLTYRDDVRDPKRLYEDFDRFMKRLRYNFKGKSTVDYINVVEPHQSGVWHCHVLMRFNDLEKVFIPSDEMERLWGQGFIKIRSLRDCDNIGAYLSAYLTDIELTEDTLFKAIEERREIQTKVVDGKEKKFIKGGRLHLYPTDMKLFRTSRGIKPPDRERMKYQSVKKIVGSAKPHYERSISFEDKETGFKNTITYQQYNMKRG